MKLFREKRVIEFDEKSVEVYELDVKSLVKLSNKEVDINEIIVENSNLTPEEIKLLTFEAYNLIVETFLDLNSRFFSSKGEKLDKKKSSN